MCGIFSLLNNTSFFQQQFIYDQFMKGQNRGPEFSSLQSFLKCMLGFHRLAINGLNDASNQPIIIGDVALICNGEIYNYKELYKMIDVEPTTQSDCEIIIHLYNQYGMKQTLQMLDGVFSFILCDSGIYNKYSKIYVARDPYGVRPLYILKPKNTQNDVSAPIYGFASELKVLTKFNNSLPNYTVEHFKPGTYSKRKCYISCTWVFKHIIRDAK
jgi:asparagine synthase (glutamine-hydrolysing)